MEPAKKSARKKPWLKRLAWLLGLWIASILVLTIATFGLKFVMRAVGFHT